MKFVDEQGSELTLDQAIALSPAVQDRIAENRRVLPMTEDDHIQAIANRLMREPHPPKSMKDALDVAKDSYEQMTKEGE